MSIEETVMVVGAGQMGTGIAQVFAQSGYTVLLHDTEEEQIHRAISSMTKQLTKRAEKGKLAHQAVRDITQRLAVSTDLKDVQQTHLVIEAASEQMKIKKQIFGTLDQFAPDDTIFATNTSSLSITELAAVTKRPEKVIGMHFMNPVPVMKLVEVIRALQTDDATYQFVFDTAKTLDKTPIEVEDFPGFVSNRILMPMINEAIYTLYEGVADVESIDGIMTLGMNHPMGPLRLADLIGLDTCLFIMNTLHEGLGDSKYRPCPLLKKYVNAGWLGKKTKRGFYTYHDHS
ncbi:3-hydroxybutyryl-CoA dehydrogenase [Bacillus altitudinis]|uniref:3-hydroxybutyryl-CoA dehydrogenase n=1 Tax=Bacillus altitudinis TaxID=293387 RepID=UPI002EA2A645|nr:3-hydroxybutyryl-CoA dehydrogenase [Bacillus altitudinis]MEE3610155.1 3-hydroxybutyryl-CoA dehydrogenase [Bacillus altitudinis]MEE3646056.1 3-hydroxybutyryl-CoA dehydrogenase [Bacillus altitudinis]MEE4390479.1 3-hydroxybutyryl-CoA dehydrogenase [Bacillus altitudinis]MEE4393905.1 3-hydroxybutyryl-CoA dehydrogenase [Bacillus altitudinis]